MHGKFQPALLSCSVRMAVHTVQIEYVVTSPFLRCLQTSTEIVAALKLPAGRWLVDWAMGEVSECLRYPSYQCSASKLDHHIVLAPNVCTNL